MSEEIDYVANLIHQECCRVRSEVGPRWWALRKELKEKYRLDAQGTIAIWAAAERAIEKKYGRDLPTGGAPDA